MLQELINHNEDLKRLQDEGYELECSESYALVHHIPYINHNKEIKYGTLVSNLSLIGNKTVRPDTHVIDFIGDYPCNKDGSELSAIKYLSQKKSLTSKITIDHSFSNKPANGYNNYYEKFVRYIEIITAPAISLDETVSAKTHKVIESEENSVFNYLDTNSSRNRTLNISSKLEKQKIGIIGLGGTGSYVLDLIAKTPVEKIHIYDGDIFSQHNAFRAPGAPDISKLEKGYSKVNYFKIIYSNMHKGIIEHDYFLDENQLDELDELDFVFISIDSGASKKYIIDHLVQKEINFVDLGMGIETKDDYLLGLVRATLCVPETYKYIPDTIPFVNDKDDMYSTNIQIAELNALNAVLGVIAWKKHIGYYQDMSNKSNSIYTINTDEIIQSGDYYENESSVC
jgi:hypothetical protein